MVTIKPPDGDGLMVTVYWSKMVDVGSEVSRWPRRRCARPRAGLRPAWGPRPAPADPAVVPRVADAEFRIHV